MGNSYEKTCWLHGSLQTYIVAMDLDVVTDEILDYLMRNN
jgi:hypothetical protein